MFIILAILVLAVSFVLALFSLVREQNKLARATKSSQTAVKKESVKKQTSNKVEVQNPDFGSQNQIFSNQVQNFDNKNPSDDFQTIEEIRAELARIVNEKSTGAEKTKPVSQMPNDVIQKPNDFGDKLSGEISLSHIRSEK